MRVGTGTRITLRVIALGYLFVLVAVPIGVILWRAFEPGLGTFLASVSYPVGGLIPNCVDVGDFNADGRDDLVVMRDDTHVSLYSQDAGGGLQPPAILASDGSPNAITGHDLDLDGRDDMIVQHGGGALGIYLQGAMGLAT